MTILIFLVSLGYSLLADDIFGRDISIAEWRYWVAPLFMCIGFSVGLFTEND
jgi:hypothetical protein